ncbi:hypothetical protein [Actinosynnema pretiosum]|uniref:Uncharacterized protein n=1 Tax=Actinosynnema pretiosum TaxID=42197 RepID=A0A290YZ99_9PSEU|nr:hypothetical protein [Actinosynnema pretiosum]ATE52101.1 hypothetical protein CNX65_01360 [Actinosynnema pretiosum]
MINRNRPAPPAPKTWGGCRETWWEDGHREFGGLHAVDADGNVVHELDAGSDVVWMDGFRSIGVWFEWCDACRKAISRG